MNYGPPVKLFCSTRRKHVFPTGEVIHNIGDNFNFTLWPFQVDKLKPPIRPISDGEGGAVDSDGYRCLLYPEVKHILSLLSEDIPLAVASRVEDIASAYQLLQFCSITSYLPLKEIYPTSKITHLKRLERRSGTCARDILFFDDNKINIRDCSRLGVKCVQVTSGLTWEHVVQGLTLFI